jgi:hypothetical protein
MADHDAVLFDLDGVLELSPRQRPGLKEHGKQALRCPVTIGAMASGSGGSISLSG